MKKRDFYDEIQDRAIDTSSPSPPPVPFHSSSSSSSFSSSSSLTGARSSSNSSSLSLRQSPHHSSKTSLPAAPVLYTQSPSTFSSSTFSSSSSSIVSPLSSVSPQSSSLILRCIHKFSSIILLSRLISSSSSSSSSSSFPSSSSLLFDDFLSLLTPRVASIENDCRTLIRGRDDVTHIDILAHLSPSLFHSSSSSSSPSTSSSSSLSSLVLLERWMMHHELHDLFSARAQSSLSHQRGDNSAVHKRMMVLARALCALVHLLPAARATALAQRAEDAKRANFSSSFSLPSSSSPFVLLYRIYTSNSLPSSSTLSFVEPVSSHVFSPPILTPKGKFHLTVHFCSDLRMIERALKGLIEREKEKETMKTALFEDYVSKPIEMVSSTERGREREKERDRERERFPHSMPVALAVMPVTPSSDRRDKEREREKEREKARYKEKERERGGEREREVVERHPSSSSSSLSSRLYSEPHSYSPHTPSSPLLHETPPFAALSHSRSQTMPIAESGSLLLAEREREREAERDRERERDEPYHASSPPIAIPSSSHSSRQRSHDSPSQYSSPSFSALAGPSFYSSSSLHTNRSLPDRSTTMRTASVPMARASFSPLARAALPLSLDSPQSGPQILVRRRSSSSTPQTPFLLGLATLNEPSVLSLVSSSSSLSVSMSAQTGMSREAQLGVMLQSVNAIRPLQCSLEHSHNGNILRVISASQLLDLARMP